MRRAAMIGLLITLLLSSGSACDQSTTVADKIGEILSKKPTISGHVYERDGVTPIPTARVSYRRVSPPPTSSWLPFFREAWATPPRPPYETVSVAPDGSYEIYDPEPGVYSVWAEAAGYERNFYPYELEVWGGKRYDRIDMLLAAWAKIQGRVDWTTNPPSRFLVGALSPDGVRSYVTEANPYGRYLLEVTEGEYYVRAGLQYYKAADSVEKATRIFAKRAETVYGIDFVLDDTRGTPPTAKPYWQFSGHVYRSDGVTPAHRTFVEVFGIDGTYYGKRVTDLKGNYAAFVPIDGSYVVVATPFDGVHITRKYYRNAGTRDEATVLTLPSRPSRSESQNIDIILDPPEREPVKPSQHSKAELGSISGHVYRTQGNIPLPHAWVATYPLDGGDTKGVKARDDGSYTLTDLRPGQYYLLSVYYSNPPTPEVFYKNSKTALEAIPVTVSPGGKVEGIDFRLLTFP